MYNFTAADFADTGQWRLIVNIKRQGLEAFLENTIHDDAEAQPLCTVLWNGDKNLMKKNIENAVYDNPRLLDDFATKIVLYDSRALLVPTELVEETSGFEEDFYNEIYPCDPVDVMSERDGDITALWEMGPGVKSFLYRTFPGARITCNLLEKVKECRGKGKKTRLSIFARNKEADLILTKGKELIAASTQEWKKQEDLVRLSSAILHGYEINAEATEFDIEGVENPREIIAELRKKG